MKPKVPCPWLGEAASSLDELNAWLKTEAVVPMDNRLRPDVVVSMAEPFV